MFDSYAEIFAERGAAYHHAMAQSPRTRDAEFLVVLEPLAAMPDGLICDMPSGGGYLAARLPPGMRYLGVDPASDFVSAFPDGLDRLQADITNVPLNDHAVDYVVSLAALHHEPDLPAVFREMRRLVRPGGRIVIADAAVDTPPVAFLNGFVDQNNPMGHHGRFLDDRTTGLLEAEGLAVVDDRLVEVPWAFDSLAEAGEFCRHLFWMPALDAAAVADAMQREIGFDVVDGRPRLRWVLRRIVCNIT
ncbi:class I SAM-dependent methyltransferase [Sphingomonas sp.]|uniref:class I SAM-dependent methyltransferase n=1 Tax=Sphingomonas sp. TaxID=28214 RepID=UPI00286C3ED2|nr:class I SAM-dependent methyltransferase [Sphingomonas sp.]